MGKTVYQDWTITHGDRKRWHDVHEDKPHRKEKYPSLWTDEDESDEDRDQEIEEELEASNGNE